MSRTYADPAQFEQRFGSDLGTLLRGLLVHVKDGATEVVHEAARARTPVGSGRDKHPGQLLASLGLVRASGLESSEIGFGSKGTAVYAAVVNRGRKRSKPYTFTTKGGASAKVERRMLGSKQENAKRGMFRGAVRELRRQWPAVVDAAFGKVGG